MKNAIEISNLTKFYGKHRGVENISLNVSQGDIFGFLGPNGAGKSTTIRCLLGMLHFQEGGAKLLGRTVGAQQKEILQNIGYLPSEVMFYPHMRVEQVIRYAANVRGLDCAAEASRLSKKMEVDLEKKISELSLGNRKKVGIVCAMQHKPGLLILDEPTSGLDPLMQEVFFELLLEANAEGTTVFMSSHVLPEVKKYCKNAAIIKEGRLIKKDTVENLTKTKLRKIKLAGVMNELDVHKIMELPGVSDFEQKGQEVLFCYKDIMSNLITNLQGVQLEDMLVEEPSLEESFMHYYEDDVK